MTLVNRRVFEQLCLLLAALFAAAWAVTRACVQAITLDEADTYFWFVARSAGYIWYPFANNHVLNTLLMWLTTRAFGISAFTVRAPALLGAAIYIGACYFLCLNLIRPFVLRLSVFICLTYNPFIFDFMVAARGYSLANAFLVVAIAIPVLHQVSGRIPLLRACILASVALGLSFDANFSFAFVDLAAMLALLTWAMAWAPWRDRESALRVAASCLVPALLVTLLICGYPLLHWKREDLWWGAHSLTEMRQSLVQASLYRLDPSLEGSGLYRLMDALRPRLLPSLGILCAAQLIVARVDGAWLQDAKARWLGRLTAALASIVLLSVLMSWFAFRVNHLPLPLGRTGIYLVPLVTLVAAAIALAPARTALSNWIRRGISAVFICLACYFLLCLRLTYFKEYEFDADIKDVYSVLAQLNHTYGVSDVGVNGLYVSPLNFYRLLSKRESFPEFIAVARELPGDQAVYVLHGPWEQEFMEKKKLGIIYRGKITDVVVAVKPGGPVPLATLEPCRVSCGANLIVPPRSLVSVTR
jgi:hypothetical protein